MNTLDDVRAKYPHLALTLYALTPGGPVMLEIITADGNMFYFQGATEAAVVAAGFTDDETPADPPPAPNVFD